MLNFGPPEIEPHRPWDLCLYKLNIHIINIFHTTYNCILGSREFYLKMLFFCSICKTLDTNRPWDLHLCKLESLYENDDLNLYLSDLF